MQTLFIKNYEALKHNNLLQAKLDEIKEFKRFKLISENAMGGGA